MKKKRILTIISLVAVFLIVLNVTITSSAYNEDANLRGLFIKASADIEPIPSYRDQRTYFCPPEIGGTGVECTLNDASGCMPSGCE